MPPARSTSPAPTTAPRSRIAAITAAKVGPFDLGTVVVRQALKINPETAEVFIDATGSDPIPHIIKGIPVHARDIRAYVDRPEFVLNPTSCERTSTASTVLGSGLDFGSDADDQPITVTSPFQAADCASLGFEPKLGAQPQGRRPSAAATRPCKAILHPRARATRTRAASQVHPAALGLPRSVPHQDDLHPGPVQRRRGQRRSSARRLDLRPRQGDHARSSTSRSRARSSCAPPPTPCPTSSPPCTRLIDFNLVGRIDSVKGGRSATPSSSSPTPRSPSSS